MCSYNYRDFVLFGIPSTAAPLSELVFHPFVSIMENQNDQSCSAKIYIEATPPQKEIDTNPYQMHYYELKVSKPSSQRSK
jgi:hypothetical protein